MKTLGHVVPLGWAVDAWTTVLSRGGGITDSARNLALLAAFAADHLGVATWHLRRTLAR